MDEESEQASNISDQYGDSDEGFPDLVQVLKSHRNLLKFLSNLGGVVSHGVQTDNLQGQDRAVQTEFFTESQKETMGKGIRDIIRCADNLGMKILYASTPSVTGCEDVVTAIKQKLQQYEDTDLIAAEYQRLGFHFPSSEDQVVQSLQQEFGDRGNWPNVNNSNSRASVDGAKSPINTRSPIASPGAYPYGAQDIRYKYSNVDSTEPKLIPAGSESSIENSPLTGRGRGLNHRGRLPIRNHPLSESNKPRSQSRSRLVQRTSIDEQKVYKLFSAETHRRYASKSNSQSESNFSVSPGRRGIGRGRANFPSRSPVGRGRGRIQMATSRAPTSTEPKTIADKNTDSAVPWFHAPKPKMMPGPENFRGIFVKRLDLTPDDLTEILVSNRRTSIWVPKIITTGHTRLDWGLRFGYITDEIAQDFVDALDIPYNAHQNQGIKEFLIKLQKGCADMDGLMFGHCPHPLCDKIVTNVDDGHFCKNLRGRWTNHHIPPPRLHKANLLLDQYHVRPGEKHCINLPSHVHFGASLKS